MEQDTRHDIAVHSKFCQNTSQLVFCKLVSPWIYFRIPDSLRPIQFLMLPNELLRDLLSWHHVLFSSGNVLFFFFFTPSEIELLKQEVTYMCTCPACPRACEEDFQVLGSKLLPSTLHLGKYFYLGGDSYHWIPGLWYIWWSLNTVYATHLGIALVCTCYAWLILEHGDHLFPF